MMDKQKLKDFLVARETEKIKTFENNLNAFISDSQIDYNETRDEDDYVHHYQSATDSNVAHGHLHVHTDHLKILQNLDVSPSEKVRPGAVIQVNGRYMVVAVAESAFEFGGGTIYFHLHSLAGLSMHERQKSRRKLPLQQAGFYHQQDLLNPHAKENEPNGFFKSEQLKTANR
ncbi:MAG: hypothetical protein JNL13_05705 [Chitinophagaceae bacterium]|nr:hypothetical protein [Chitinophagaceae bacterium]